MAALTTHDYEVHAASRRPRSTPGVNWHQADLLNASETAQLLAEVRPSHLVHLAWVVVPGEYWSSPLNVAWVVASLELIRQFAAIGGRRAVVVGTGAEYDPAFGRCVERQTPTSPTSIYGAAKASLGLLLPPVAAAWGLESTAWARLFYVFGPHESPRRVVPSAVRALLEGKRFLCSNADQVRDTLMIEDAADALAALLVSEVTGPVNIASGHGLAMRALLSAVGDQMGKRSKLDFQTSGSTYREAACQVADVRRLTDEVGWRPSFTLETGVARAITWWRDQVGIDG
ncbi:MAG: NAD(P)-dependent oxidoreductase [Chloroflexi bacterium]|nr:NAD(P)-dependent oxidoreductase [Chloroflexota bacterium]